ncbi:MAG TPA: hypothetical protein ENK68_02990, partial [Epsilonproteobacteria bacterium]|nr:hypothetical protein [Campylobacterota bacterium]
MILNKVFLIAIAFFSVLNTALFASQDNNQSEKESPWIFTPLISSAPKLGTSLGAMGGYIYKFDEESPASTFILTGTYSSTDSSFIGLFGKMYFDEDYQRLMAGTIYGTINNEYKDFLGTGKEFKTTDDIHAIFTRYQYTVRENWTVGAQLVIPNYAISGSDDLRNGFLEAIGL